MARWRISLVLLLLTILLLPVFAAADSSYGTYFPGSTFELTFKVSENPNFARSAMVKIEYDHTAFSLIPSSNIRNDTANITDNSGIQIGYTLKVSFTVLKKAQEKSYTFQAIPDPDTETGLLGQFVDGLALSPISVQIKKKATASRPENVHSAEAFGYCSYVHVEAAFENGKISWISIGDQKFAEEKGKLVLEDRFQKQFIGKKLPVELSDIDGYTGATITANAVLEALNRMNENYLVSIQKKEKTSTYSTCVYPFPTAPNPSQKPIVIVKNDNVTITIGFCGNNVHLPKGTKLEVIGELLDSTGTKWFMVKLPDGNIGYIQVTDVAYYSGWFGTSNCLILQGLPTPTPKSSPTITPLSKSPISLSFDCIITLKPLVLFIIYPRF